MTESLQEIEWFLDHFESAVLTRGWNRSNDETCVNQMRDKLISAITRVVQERDKLREALEKHGKHKPGCYDKRQVVPRCVCGLNAALSTAEGKP